MAEASWGDTLPGPIDWAMSAALENVQRGDETLPEVTNLERAVRAWLDLDREMRSQAVLTLEHPVKLSGGMPLNSLLGDAIKDLAERLPS